MKTLSWNFSALMAEIRYLQKDVNDALKTKATLTCEIDLRFRKIANHIGRLEQSLSQTPVVSGQRSIEKTESVELSEDSEP